MTKMTKLPYLKSQAEIHAEEDRRAQIDSAWEIAGDMIGIACLVALVTLPLFLGHAMGME